MVHNFWVSITRLEEAFKVSRISTFLSVRLKVDLKRMPCSSIPPSPLPGLTIFVIFAQLHYLLQRPDPAAFAFLFIPFHALEVSYGQWLYFQGTAEALEDRRQRCADLRHAVPSAVGQVAEICKFKPGTELLLWELRCPFPQQTEGGSIDTCTDVHPSLLIPELRVQISCWMPSVFLPNLLTLPS